MRWGFIDSNRLTRAITRRSQTADSEMLIKQATKSDFSAPAREGVVPLIPIFAVQFWRGHCACGCQPILDSHLQRFYKAAQHK